MKLTPLSEITDQIIAAVTERIPQASMVVRFGDDCYTLPREKWLIKPATGEVELQIMTEIRERRVTVRTPLGTPSSPEHWADNLDAFSMCMVDEAAAQYLLSLWGIKPDKSQEPPTKPPKGRHQYQQDLILQLLRELEYDPKNLPPPPSGKSGPKADARAKIGSAMSKGVFEKAWERLRRFGDIQDAD